MAFIKFSKNVLLLGMILIFWIIKYSKATDFNESLSLRGISLDMKREIYRRLTIKECCHMKQVCKAFKKN